MGTHKKEKVCQTCGGYFPKYEQLLATCSECKTACVHVYCMWKLKQEVPQDWVCESCLSGNDVILPKSSGKEDSIVTYSDHGHRDVVTFLGRQVYSKKQKPVETGKVKFIPHEEVTKLSIPPEEVIKLSLGAIETRYPSKGSRSLKPGCTWTTSKRNSPKSINANPKFFSDRVKFKRLGLVRPSGDDALPKSSLVNQCLSQSFAESKGGKDVAERNSTNIQKGELQILTLPASYGLYRAYLLAATKI